MENQKNSKCKTCRKNRNRPETDGWKPDKVRCQILHSCGIQFGKSNRYHILVCPQFEPLRLEDILPSYPGW